MAAVTHVKIYGERNSGTTVLHRSVRRNFDIGIIRKKGVRRERRRRAEEAAGALAGRARRETREAAIDDLAAETMEIDLGWKHCAPPLDLIAADPRTPHILFLVITKHPCFWLGSMFRNPYHRLTPGGRPTSFSAFLREPWTPVGRDNIGEATLPSAADLYRVKLERYRDLLDAAPHALHIRYEDFVGDYQGTFDRIADKLGAPKKAWDLVEKSVKASDDTFEDYARRYRLEEAGADFDTADLALIDRAIPAPLAERFGYRIAAAQASARPMNA